MTIAKWLMLALGLALSGAGWGLEDQRIYYRVTHRDLRRCAAPLCGGYFVQAVNRRLTRCPDGSEQAECYACSIEYSALGPAPPGRKEFAEEFGEGFGLAKGDLQNRPSPFGVAVGVLQATAAWRAQAEKPPTGRFYCGRKAAGVCLAYQGECKTEAAPAGK